MTVIEQQTINAIISACHSYNKPKIDWEQRRYEIVKDIITQNPIANYASIQEAIKVANLIIEQLKQENQNGNK